MSNDCQIGVRIPRELRDALEARAARERYDLSDEVRRALWQHVEKDEGRDLTPGLAETASADVGDGHARSYR